MTDYDREGNATCSCGHPLSGHQMLKATPNATRGVLGCPVKGCVCAEPWEHVQRRQWGLVAE